MRCIIEDNMTIIQLSFNTFPLTPFSYLAMLDFPLFSKLKSHHLVSQTAMKNFRPFRGSKVDLGNPNEVTNNFL